MNFHITIYEDGRFDKPIYIYCKHYIEAIAIREKISNNEDIIIIDGVSKKGRLIIHQEALKNLFIKTKGD